MDAYSWIAVLTLASVLLSVWRVRKREDYKYSMLDTSGRILNTVLILMVYPPLCLLCGFMATGEYTERFPIVLEGAAVVLARLMPSVCVAGIGASIVLRRKERPGLSFLLQFAGGLWYCIIMTVANLNK